MRGSTERPWARNVQAMHVSKRLLPYVTAGTLMVIGLICAGVIHGNAGPLIGVFIVGLGGILLLITVCFEVKLGSDDDAGEGRVPHSGPSEEALRAEELRREQNRRHAPSAETTPAHHGEHRLAGRVGGAAQRRRQRRPS